MANRVSDIVGDIRWRPIPRGDEYSVRAPYKVGRLFKLRGNVNPWRLDRTRSAFEELFLLAEQKHFNRKLSPRDLSEDRAERRESTLKIFEKTASFDFRCIRVEYKVQRIDLDPNRIRATHRRSERQQNRHTPEPEADSHSGIVTE